MSDDALLQEMGYPADDRHRHILRQAKLVANAQSLPLTAAVLAPMLAKALGAPRQAAPAQTPAQTSGPTGGQDRKPRITPWSAREHAPLARAPFRFVPLNESVSLAEDQPDRDRPVEGNLCATLVVDWRVETPILVAAGDKADGADRPFVLSGPDDWALPGATLRGAMRAALEAVAHGRLVQTNRRYRFALRDFDHPVYRQFIADAGTGDGMLKAGWLERRAEGGFAIRPCRRWGRVPIDALTRGAGGSSWAMLDRRDKYLRFDASLRRPEGKRDGVDWDGAFAAPRPVAPVPGEAGVYAPAEGGGAGVPGILVFTGAATNADRKRFEYVFFDDPDAAPVPVGESAWLDFEIVNTEPGDRRREPQGAWAEYGGPDGPWARLPVFYFGDLATPQGPEFSFGLTRLYRLPHRYSVGAKIPPRHALAADGDGRLRADIVEALFGYVYEEEDLPDAARPPFSGAQARKGRVAFGFATVVDRARFRPWPEQPAQAVQAAPKPQFAPFYLVGKVKDWSDPQAALAGRKRYLPRDDAAPFAGLAQAMADSVADVKASKGNVASVVSKLQFLAPDGDARFRGEIRLHNVSEADLGALLWVLTFGGDGARRHMLGRGKPFGAGRVAVARIAATLRRNGAPDAPERLDWTIGAGAGVLAPFFDRYEQTMDAALGGVGRWLASPAVRAFLAAAAPQPWDAEATRYLRFAPDDGNRRRAGRFLALRQATGPNSDGAPARLLDP